MTELLIDQLMDSANAWTIAFYFFIFGLLFGLMYSLLYQLIDLIFTRGRATSPLVTKSKK